LPEPARRWIERVEAWAKEQEIEESSQKCYADHLRRFPEYFEAVDHPGIRSPSAVTRDAVRAFKYEGVGVRGKRRGKPLRITTRSMDLGLLASFLAWEVSRQKTPDSRLAKLVADRKLFRIPKGKVRSQEIRRMESREEIAKVLKNAPSKEARAVFALGLYGGLRPGEARALLVEDQELTFGGRIILRLSETKGSKPRPVKLPAQATPLILAATVGKRPEDRIYPYGRSKHAKDLERACVKAKTRRYTPHNLRHTYTAEMFTAGAQLEAVQQLLGHEDPKTTRHYQGDVLVDRAIDALERYLGA
jgi:integrase